MRLRARHPPLGRGMPEPGFARVDPLRGRVSEGLQEKNQRESIMSAPGDCSTSTLVQYLASAPAAFGGQRAPDRKRRALHQAEIGARAGPIWHYVALRGTTWHKIDPYM